METTSSDDGSRREIKSYRRNRRKRSKSRLQDPSSGRIIATIMTLVAVAYVTGMAAFWYVSTAAYAGVGLGSNPAEVLYALGEPAAVRGSEGERWTEAAQPTEFAQWRYGAPTIIVRFDESGGRARSVLCDFDESASRMPCPPAMGVSIGDDEAAVLAKLGKPSSEFLADGRKIMRYRETGHDFVLERLHVRSVRLSSSDAGLPAKAVRFLAWLIP